MSLRVRQELSARAALAEQRRAELRRRLRPEGVSLDAVARSLDWPGGDVGVRQVLRELAERDEAHERDGLLFPGPHPDPPRSKVPVLAQRPALPRPPWLADAYARGAEGPRPEPPPLSPEAVMDSAADVLRRQIVDYVTNNPGAKVSAIAKFVEAERELVSRLLVAERNRGVLRLEGSRAQSRWFRAAAIPSSPPPAASRGAPASSSVEEDDPARELALVDQVLDGLGLPQVHRLARLALLAAHGPRGVAA